MKRTTKLLALLLVAILLVSFAAGCKKQSEKIELTYSLWGSEAELTATQAVLDRYTAEVDPNVVITAIQIDQTEYTTKLLSMASAGNLPDAGMVIEQSILGWAKEGLLTTDDIYKGQDNQPLSYLAFKDNGTTVAWSAANEVLALWYNKDMFAEAGIDAPPATIDDAWTWDEFINVAKLLTKDKNGKNATEAGFDKNNVVQYGCYINQIAWQLEVWALSNGGRFFSEDGTKVVFDNKAIEAVQNVVNLYVELGISPLCPDQADKGFEYGVGSGKVAMSTEGAWATGNNKTHGADSGYPNLNYGVAVLPYMQTKVTIATGGATAAFAGSKHPAEAAAFVRWYMSPEQNMGLIDWGWWMPTLSSWYTDPELIAKWVDDNDARSDIGADAFKTAVVDVAMNTSVTKSTCWYYTPNTDKVYAILGPALMDAINGTKTVQQVIDSIRPQMEAALAGE